MHELLKSHLGRAFRLTRELVDGLEESALLLDLPGVPSNRIAAQLWCVVGARESYARAIESGAWRGFACSLKTPRSKPSVLIALQDSRQLVEAIDFASLSEDQLGYAFDLLEHETQHHGQLIRYVCAHRLDFPGSWKARYAL